MENFTDEQLAAINEMIAAKVDEETKALKTKNAELISEKRTATTKAKEEQEAREAAEQDALAKSGDVEALKTSLTTKYEKMIKERDEQLRAITVDGAISAAISKGNVMPGMVDVLTAFYRTQADYKDGRATIGGEDIHSFINSHLSSDAGGAFVRAPANSGGGATGSSAKAGSWTKPPETADEWSRWMQFTVDSPAEATSLATGWNKPELKP